MTLSIWLRLLLAGGIFIGVIFLLDRFLLDNEYGFVSYAVKFVVFVGLMAAYMYYKQKKAKKKRTEDH